MIKQLLFPCSLDFNLGFFNYGCELNFCDSSSCSLVGAPLSILVLTSIISVTATYWQQLLVFPPLRRIVFALCPQFLLDPQRLVGNGISRSHCDKSLLLLFRSTVQNIDPPCRRKSEQRHQTFCGHNQLHHYHFYSNCKRTHLIARFASTLEIFSDSRSPLCPINTKTTYATLHF